MKKIIIHTNRFIAYGYRFCYSKPVFMFYQHALSEACTFTDFLQVMLHGLKLDCTIAGYLTAIPPIDFSISLASGRLVEEGIERVLLDHGNSWYPRSFP